MGVQIMWYKGVKIGPIRPFKVKQKIGKPFVA